MHLIKDCRYPAKVAGPLARGVRCANLENTKMTELTIDELVDLFEDEELEKARSLLEILRPSDLSENTLLMSRLARIGLRYCDQHKDT